jgi:hypothetical protein
MGRKKSSVEVVRTEGAEHFGFLVRDEGFVGPEPTADGIRYHRGEVGVDVSFFHDHFRDLQVSTCFEVPGEDGSRRQWIKLEDLYIACGLGPSQDVPGGAQTLHALRKHLAVQAQVLRRLLTFLAAQEVQPAPVSWFQS